jgi:hypothetical protein
MTTPSIQDLQFAVDITNQHHGGVGRLALVPDSEGSLKFTLTRVSTGEVTHHDTLGEALTTLVYLSRE